MSGSSITSDDRSGSVGVIGGTFTHDTGGINLVDGTFLFVDPNGPESDGYILDGGNDGYIGNQISGSYDYVFQFDVCCGPDPTYNSHLGVAGISTAAADMPVAGSASYTGEASARIYHLYPTLASGGSFHFFDNGVSQIDVDFASGSASVSMTNFANISDSVGSVLTSATAPFDQIQGSGLVIQGSHMVGGNWVTMSGGAVVNVVGANPVTSADGTFFGYDPSISAPDEVGGVIFIGGSDSNVTGIYVAD